MTQATPTHPASVSVTMSPEEAIPVPAASLDIDVEGVRSDFPVLAQRIYGKPLVYLDNAATTQVPQVVLEAISAYETTYRANVNRGVHLLSQKSTDAFEEARTKASRFLNAPDEREVIFVRGTTEAINLVAQTFGPLRIGAGDEIVLTAIEHHANIVPWQLLRARTGAVIRVAPVDDSGELIWDEYEKLLGPRTRLVACVHVSNALGTVNPVKRMADAAHARGIPVLVDGAQSAPHQKIDVQALGCDFFAFSGHKLYGPNGIGVLWGRRALLEEMPPWQGGGDMIASVTFEETEFNDLPWKFEAGTPNISGAIGLGAAIDYVESIGLDRIASREHMLTEYGTNLLKDIEGLRIIGQAREKAGILSFVLEGVHPHDLGTILDREGVAVRAGHHCAQPVMDRFCVPATVRASISFYNTTAELDALARAILKAQEIFG